jgi:hypothetical protein
MEANNVRERDGMRYVVKTMDVDGRAPGRYFKTLAGARKRFEAMYGHPLENAIVEQYVGLRDEPAPKVEDVRYVRGVSDYGCVVTLKVIDDPEPRQRYADELPERDFYEGDSPDY